MLHYAVMAPGWGWSTFKGTGRRRNMVRSRLRRGQTLQEPELGHSLDVCPKHMSLVKGSQRRNADILLVNDFWFLCLYAASCTDRCGDIVLVMSLVGSSICLWKLFGDSPTVMMAIAIEAVPQAFFTELLPQLR